MRKFHWKHKNLVLLLLGILVAYFISRNQELKDFLLKIGELDYLGAFLAGALFTSTFTAATGVLILFDLAKDLSAFPLIALAALGAVSVDFLVFTFVKKSIIAEITPIYEELERLGKKNHLKKLLHTKYFAWTLPVLGALIIISPLSDELGVGLMGISNIKPLRFLLISLCSHGLGMFLVVTAARLI
ncbi:hypothetical protein COT03_01315 [Candidatus Shapirobacteria bacterium CG07_land_8_20_14_0_80_39_18]|uniref:TVP38/TMEM64 family membrane protein n=1 Tax=Candidatus Shapirobacteria bacterium CG07_land_8_20_14_0_80_39_18 TaxID=1974882 RepID=A0A2M6YRJ4_9BACT|nr:MAG: hypothetical protein COT03_01315 [Candidatus Shapirobacteria bacterium CG07_land_8_20_14_0_80_39_18]